MSYDAVAGVLTVVGIGIVLGCIQYRRMPRYRIVKRDYINQLERKVIHLEYELSTLQGGTIKRERGGQLKFNLPTTPPSLYRLPYLRSYNGTVEKWWQVWVFSDWLKVNRGMIKVRRDGRTLWIVPEDRIAGDRDVVPFRLEKDGEENVIL